MYRKAVRVRVRDEGCVLTRSLGPSVTIIARWTAAANENEGIVSAAANAAAQKLFLVADALLRNGGGHVVSQWSMADVELTVMLKMLFEKR